MANKKRTKLTRKVDNKIFTKTAKKTKAINVEPTTMRGGIRL